MMEQQVRSHTRFGLVKTLALCVLAGVVLALGVPATASAVTFHVKGQAAGIQVEQSSPLVEGRHSMLQVQVYQLSEKFDVGAPSKSNGTIFQLGESECHYNDPVHPDQGYSCQGVWGADCQPRSDVIRKLGELGASLRGTFDCTPSSEYNNGVPFPISVDLTWSTSSPPDSGEPVTVSGSITDGTVEYLQQAGLDKVSAYMLFENSHPAQ